MMSKHSLSSMYIADEILSILSSQGTRRISPAAKKIVRDRVSAMLDDAEAALSYGWIDSSKDDSWTLQAADAMPAGATGMKGVNLNSLTTAINTWWANASKDPQAKLQVLEKLHPDDSIPDSVFSMLRDKAPEEINSEFPSIAIAMSGKPAPEKTEEAGGIITRKELEAIPPVPAKKDIEEEEKPEKNPPIRKPAPGRELEAPVNEFEHPEVPGVPGDGRVR